MSARKEMRKAIRACEKAGLVYDPNHKHPRVTDPKTRKFVSFSATPNCPFAVQHMLADVRKYLGVNIRL